MRQYMYFKEHEVLKKAHKHEYENILDRWNKYDKYRKYLSDIGWIEEGLPCLKRRKKLEREIMETLFER